MYQYHPRHIHHHFLRNLHIPTVFFGVIFATFVLSLSTFVFASATANFRMIVNPGVLAVGMVDSSFVAVSQPLVDMGQVFQDASCQSVGGTFGTSSQKIYVKNPGVADNGWVVTLSAASPQDTWQGNGAHFDFNDTANSGCTDGIDTDVFAGKMTVSPIAGNISLGACSLSCQSGNVIPGSMASFEEGINDVITLLSASAASSDSADWLLQGVAITQTIPQNQSLSDNYSLQLFLSVTAN